MILSLIMHVQVQSLESIERRHLSGGDKKPTAAAAGATGAPSTAESSQHLQRLLQRLQSGPDTGTQAAGSSPGTSGVPSGGVSEPSVAPSHQHGAPSVPDKQPKQPSPTHPDMNQALIEKLKSGSGSAPGVSLMKPSSTTLTPSLLASQGSAGTTDTSRVPPAMKQLFPGPKDRKVGSQDSQFCLMVNDTYQIPEISTWHFYHSTIVRKKQLLE